MRPLVLLGALLFALLCCACRSRAGAPSPAPSTSSSYAVSPAAVGRLVLSGAPAKNGEVTVTLENGTENPIDLDTELIVERIGDAGWEEIFTSGLKIRPNCDAPIGRCMTLMPRAALRPPPWLGMEGDAQCACKECATARPGRYRFVARRCDGTAQIEGEPFDYAR